MANETINPWLDISNESWLRNEIDIVKNQNNFSYALPDKAIEWICKNKQEKRLLQALVDLAPMYPLVAHHGEPSLWLSPPPSGSANNDVVVVMGMDHGRLRMVGCNFCAVKAEKQNDKSISNFWAAYDACSGELQTYRLISAFVSENFSDASLSQAKESDNMGYNFKTMPLYIACIDKGAVHIWSMPCLIWADHPSDMRLEMLKEF